MIIDRLITGSLQVPKQSIEYKHLEELNSSARPFTLSISMTILFSIKIVYSLSLLS